MEEPTSTVTAALADEFRHAINALPVAHTVEPHDKEVVESQEVRYVHTPSRLGIYTRVRFGERK